MYVSSCRSSRKLNSTLYTFNTYDIYIYIEGISPKKIYENLTFLLRFLRNQIILKILPNGSNKFRIHREILHFIFVSLPPQETQVTKDAIKVTSDGKALSGPKDYGPWKVFTAVKSLGVVDQ